MTKEEEMAREIGARVCNKNSVSRKICQNWGRNWGRGDGRGGKKKAKKGSGRSHVETGDQNSLLKLVIVGGALIRDMRKLILSFTG
jgi:hypothetical protein